MQPTTTHDPKRQNTKEGMGSPNNGEEQGRARFPEQPQRPGVDSRRGRPSLSHLQDVHLEASRLFGAQLPLLEGQAGAPPDALVVQCLRDEESKRLRRTAHPETVRQAEALEVQVLEVVVAVGLRCGGYMKAGSVTTWPRRAQEEGLGRERRQETMRAHM